MHTNPPKRRLPYLGAAVAFSFLACPARADAQVEYYQHRAARFPEFTTAFRLGGSAFVDGDAGDLYGGIFESGIDFKLHFFHLPLAAQTSFDFGYGDADRSDLAEVGIAGDDADFSLFRWRVSLLLEPPPRYWGSEHFYVQPYVGGGIGVDYVEEEIEQNVGFGFVSDSRSESGFGWHGIAGIDFVFGSHVSTGVEVVYSDADFDTPQTDLELGSFTVSATFKWHF